MATFISRVLTRHSETARAWLFKKNAYNKYGLYHDDLVGGYNATVNPVAAEAYRRLLIDKPEMHDERCYRAVRAAQLKIQKEVLPQDQWVTYEEDCQKGYYLQPYMEEVRRELSEKENWEANHA